MLIPRRFSHGLTAVLFTAAVGVPAFQSAFAPQSSVMASTSKGARVAQGRELFAEKGCAHCHGEAGLGGSDSGPDLSKVRKELKPVQIAQQIHDGGKNMPPFGDSLSQDEIASLVAYLRSKRVALPHAQAPPVAVVPATKPDPE